MGRLIRRIKNSQIIYVLIIIILICILGLLIYIYYDNDEVEESITLVLQDETVHLEYGEVISLEAADYLDASQMSEEVIAATTVSSDATYETYETVDEDGQDMTETYDYPAVGEYTLTLTYEDVEATVALIVEDTTAPEFIDLAQEYTLNDGEVLDVSDFSAEDLSTVTITLDDDAVDYLTAGTYTATLKAVDIYDNETTATIKVIVYITEEVIEEQEDEEEEEETTTSSSSTSSNSTSSSSSTTSSSHTSSNTSSSTSNTETSTDTTDETVSDESSESASESETTESEESSEAVNPEE